MKVFLYGIGSASEAYRVHYYRWLEDEEISFLRIWMMLSTCGRETRAFSTFIRSLTDGGCFGIIGRR